MWAFSARKTHEDLAQSSLKQYGRAWRAGSRSGRTRGAVPSGTGQDGAVGTRGTCCFAISARTRSPCGERISGRPSRRSSLCTHRWSGRTPLCRGWRVELAHCISDGGLQHHAVAELQHIGEDPLLDLTDCGDIVVNPFLGSGSTLSRPTRPVASAAASSSIRSTSM